MRAKQDRSGPQQIEGIQGNVFTSNNARRAFAVKLLLRKFDKDLSPVDRDGKRRLTEMCVQAVAAGCHIKLPTVPGTRHDVASDGPLGEWTAGMRADSIQGPKTLFQMKQRDDPATSDKLATCSNRNL